ncbi:hypothetical protein B5807_04330 [Epicoccum nigrum]|uniref:Uncharacterized protein n=1 Tax=Epicoccum nigrum TaxID=105696 RepID=A0A1Y2M4M1_EPING|nr:hypothetical protein B5807_04330 [Epicoccum nigrum]
MSRTTSSTIVPAVPVVPVTAAKPETPAKTKKGKQAVKAAEVTTATPVISAGAIPATPTKAPAKASAAKAPAPSELSSKVADPVLKKTESKERKPTPEVSAKSKTATKKVDKVETSAEKSNKHVPTKDNANASIATVNTNASAKRQPPSKLDIPAAKLVEKEPVAAATPTKGEPQTKNARVLPPTTAPSVPASPAVAVAPSPIKHTAAPRTLRLVSTPKVETPPVVAAPTPPLPQIPTVDKLRSRQASIASLNQPGTPASDLISDTASMTSGMISRANSPPPGTIVGSAPVRKVTKAQAKKNRQERKRQEEEKGKAEAGSDVEVVQAPIIGRKKKAKKPSTTPKPLAAMASAMKEAAAKSQPASPKSATVEDEPLETPTLSSVKAQSAHNSASATPEPETQPEDARERREPTAQSVLNDLQKTGDLLVSALEFFKPLSSTLTHTSRSNQSGHPTSPPDLKIHFSEADLDALARKKPVHLSGQDGKPDSRTLITPNGKFLWGLTAELEEKALSLENEIERLTGCLRFHPSTRTAPHHHQPSPYPSTDVLPAIATALKEAGKTLPTSPDISLKFDPQAYAPHLPPVHHPADFNAPPVPVQQQTPADAGAYLNQFVLPATDNPPPNHPRPEMAAVGGTPGSGTTHISMQPGAGRQAESFEKAARAVVEGGAVGSTEIDGIASMVGDRSGGVWVRGLEGLVGAGLGVGGAWEHDRIRNVLEDLRQMGYAMRPPQDRGAGPGPGPGAANPSAGGRQIERSCVLSLEEAEAAMVSARREQEVLERKLGALVKRNRKVAGGSAR